MTAEDWCRLRDEVLSVSNAELSRRVGVTKDTGDRYSKGAAKIPASIAMACAAVARGLQPWPH